LKKRKLVLLALKYLSFLLHTKHFSAAVSVLSVPPWFDIVITWRFSGHSLLGGLKIDNFTEN
jgi:hypothetical protein